MLHNILEKYQSGFRTNHSTETALLKILNDIRCNLDNHKLTVLVLLDLTAAFDTVDRHKIDWGTWSASLVLFLTGSFLTSQTDTSL